MEVTTYSKGQDRLIKIIYEIKKPLCFQRNFMSLFSFFSREKVNVNFDAISIRNPFKNSLKKLNIYDTLEDNV